MCGIGIKDSKNFHWQKKLKTLREWADALSRSGREKENLFLLVGIFFLTIAFSLKLRQIHQANVLSFSKSPPLIESVEEEDLPARIIIPKVRIDLAVESSKAVGNQWEVAQNGASYLLGSDIPGQEGNTVIYGHNKNSLFGPIRWLAVGDEIKIVNQKGEEFVYQVVEIKTVLPEAVEVLAPIKETALTLYTCTGFLDRERWVVRARL